LALILESGCVHRGFFFLDQRFPIPHNGDRYPSPSLAFFSGGKWKVVETTLRLEHAATGIFTSLFGKVVWTPTVPPSEVSPLLPFLFR